MQCVFHRGFVRKIRRKHGRRTHYFSALSFWCRLGKRETEDRCGRNFSLQACRPGEQREVGFRLLVGGHANLFIQRDNSCLWKVKPLPAGLHS